MVQPAHDHVLCSHDMVANRYRPYNYIHSANKGGVAYFYRSYPIINKGEIFNGAVIAYLKNIKRHGIYSCSAEDAGVFTFFMVEWIHKISHPPAWPYAASRGDEP